ncbi:molybdate ABC transporter substrate-binding protein [Nocardioides panzhihuensis]|uniref:Molybdate transport system substrate-binding protein n=1 Tax=Nocardioides panzhihuensis TaxID=860243 RepID=A0A7Z0DHY1_9ACTN|nr:molybdate ABC transporter substrate-binding protein [Nocardioides panzhihuensis]NYI75929.1 molybdate transport system substrate-binding protein [Nocardioides panzhihuensis]
MTSKPGIGAVVTAAVLVLAGCGSATGQADERDLTVFAAASLTDTFTELAEKFEKEHPGVKVTTSFGGSSDLVAQIEDGAPADVFASADTKNMGKLGDLATDPRDFAANTLAIATPPGNPAKISGFQDLAEPGAKVVVCTIEVPCGNAAAEMEKRTGVDIDPVSEEQSVSDVLAKVTSGDADAGLVYVTDVTAAGDSVTGVEFEESGRVVNTYPISVLDGADDAELAQAFVDLVLSETGQKVLTDAGFSQP